MSRREAAIQRIERHWAVAAISGEERRIATAEATDAWARMLAPGEAPPPLANAELISTLASAYERAALERAPGVVAALRAGAHESGSTAAATALARAELEAAARQAFALYRVLPVPPPEHPNRDYHLLRVAAMGVVGTSGGETGAWLDVVVAERPLAVEGAPWDSALRSHLAHAWLELLRGPSVARAEQAFETLGMLREEQAAREAATLAELSTTRAQQVRVHLFALYHLADAAAALVVHFRRGPRADTVARLLDSLQAARAVTMANQAFDAALQWLAPAGAMLAEGASGQIELPGISL